MLKYETEVFDQFWHKLQNLSFMNIITFKLLFCYMSFNNPVIHIRILNYSVLYTKISYTDNSFSPLSYFLDPHVVIKNPKTLDWNCRKWIESKPENITARFLNVNAEIHSSNAKKSLCMCGNYLQQDNREEEYELVWHVIQNTNLKWK